MAARFEFEARVGAPRTVEVEMKGETQRMFMGVPTVSQRRPWHVSHKHKKIPKGGGAFFFKVFDFTQRARQNSPASARVCSKIPRCAAWCWCGS